MSAPSILGILKAKPDLAITDRQVLIALHHMVYGHDTQQMAKYLDVSVMTITRELKYMEDEGVFDEIKGLDDSYEVNTRVASKPTRPARVHVDASKGEASVSMIDLIESTLERTAPKKPRKAVKAKSKPAKRDNRSAVEVPPADWTPKHLLSYMEIVWCEQNWKSPPPTIQAKERSLAKKFLEAYSGDAKKIVDYMFGNWPALMKEFNISGLPSMAIMWGFRNSIVPRAMGDVGQSASKAWGSSHNPASDRDDGDEVGW
jgi:hypothetical protein